MSKNNNPTYIIILAYSVEFIVLDKPMILVVNVLI